MKTCLLLASLFFLSPEISAQRFTVANERENIFYAGLSNPLSVTVENCPCKSIYLKTNNGKVTGNLCRYDYVPAKVGAAKITILKKTNGYFKRIGVAEFRVKRIPDPILMVGPSIGGNIQRVVLGHQQFIRTVIPNFDISIHIEIDSFKIIIIKRENVLLSKTYTGSAIAKDVRDAILSLSNNDTVLFKDVWAKFPDGTAIQLKPLVFNILE
jgi:hypothetical protein